jgi:predicted O-methyltransferase YrrM
MFSKVGTAVRYLVRPRTYPFLTRRLRESLFGGPRGLDNTRAKAEAWCRQRLQESAAALNALGVASAVDLRATFPDVFAGADARVAACPYPMGGGAGLDFLYACVKGVGANTVVETGVAYGWSSLAVLLALRDRPDGRLVSTNLHYPQFGDESFVGCAVPDDLRARWTLLRGTDKVVLPDAITAARPFDVCHYDSDKSYGGRMVSYRLLWAGLRVGGLFISDDIGDNLAFAHFCRITGHRPVVIGAAARDGTKFIGAIRKNHDRALAEWMF